MPSAETYELRTAEDSSDSLQFDDLRIVWWFDKVCRFVSYRSLTRWGFLQILVSVAYLMVTIHLFLTDMTESGLANGSRFFAFKNINERLGRILNALTAILVSFYIPIAFLGTHSKRKAIRDGNWLGKQDHHIRTYLKDSEKYFNVRVVLLALLAIFLGGSLLLEHLMSIKCHFCPNTFSGESSKALGIVGLTATLVFSLTFAFSIFLVLVDLSFVSSSNIIFADSLYNQIVSLKKKNKEDCTWKSLTELNDAYRPMLKSGAKIFVTSSRGFFFTIPCILLQTLLTLFPQAYKTSAAVSQLCFPVFCGVTLLLVMTLGSDFRDWPAEYKYRLKERFPEGDPHVERATRLFNYPKQYSFFFQKIKFDFTLKVFVVASLFALFAGGVLTLTQMYLNHRLNLRNY